MHTSEFRLEGVFEFSTPIKTMWTLISSDDEFNGPIVYTSARLSPISKPIYGQMSNNPKKWMDS